MTVEEVRKHIKREYMRKWRLENLERERAAGRRRHAEHPEKKRRLARTNRLKHREQIYEQQRRWLRANPEKASEYTAKWRAANIEKDRASQRKKRGYPEPTRPCPELCECCGGPNRGRGSMHLDHCHITRIFRGWLCNNCNTGLGKFGDNLQGLMKAVAYLQKLYITERLNGF